jgi:hypothetical protein
VWRLLWRIVRQHREQLCITLAVVRPHCRCKGRTKCANSVTIRHITRIVPTNLGGFGNFVVFEWIKVVLDVDRGPFLYRATEEWVGRSRTLHGIL